MRSFASGNWTTRGSGRWAGLQLQPDVLRARSTSTRPRMVRPRRSTSRAPGTVPWATWYEGRRRGFAADTFREPVRQHRRCEPGGLDLPGRAAGTAPARCPSLNINTNQDAENPAIAGGTTAGNNPGPWITWQETDSAPVSGRRSSSTSRRAPGRTACDRVTPSSQPPGRWLLLPDVGFQRVGGRRRSEPQRRPDARRGRARYHLHRPSDTVRGSSGTSRTPAPPASTTMRWCSRPRPSPTPPPMAALSGM